MKRRRSDRLKGRGARSSPKSKKKVAPKKPRPIEQPAIEPDVVKSSEFVEPPPPPPAAPKPLQSFEIGAAEDLHICFCEVCVASESVLSNLDDSTHDWRGDFKLEQVLNCDCERCVGMRHELSSVLDFS